MGTGSGVAGDSERFENRRIRQALERARRLRITVDGLDPIDVDAGAESDAGPPADQPPRPPADPGPSWPGGPAPSAGWTAPPAPERPPARFEDGRRHRPGEGGSHRDGTADRPVGPATLRTTVGWPPGRAAAGTPGPVVNPDPDRPAAEPDARPADGRPRTRWARRVEAMLPDLLAGAVATGALVAPWLWSTLVALLCLAVGVLAARSAGVGVARLPLHGLRRLGSLMHPRSLLWAPVLTARTVLLAVALPGAIAAGAWVLEEGALGAPAAARAGVWTHGLRVAAALVCFMLVRGVGPGRARRAVAVRRHTSRLGDRPLLASALACVAVAAVVVAVGPRVDGDRLSGADGLGWLPPTLRPTADRLRDRVVTTELDAVATCLTRRQPTVWNRSYTTGNPLDDPDVARMIVAPGALDPGDVSTAVAAAHNQLAPWVETINVDQAGATLVRVDRDHLPRDHPLTDASRLVAAASTGKTLLTDGASDVDRRTLLHCSAGPVP